MPRGEFLDLPHYLPPVYHIAHKFGVLKYAVGSQAFICSDVGHGERTFVANIGARLARISPRAPAYSVKRLDLRENGSLVVFVKDANSNQAFIVRLATDGTSRQTLKRGHLFQRRLHMATNLSAHLKSLIPVPVLEDELAGAQAFVETLLPGTLAWKAFSSSVKGSICSSATEFLRRFNDASKQQVTLDDEILNTLFREDLDHIRTASFLGKRLRNDLVKVSCRSRQLFRGKKLHLVCAHGDYGVGNVLVDKKRGTVTGIIDWDCGRAFEFPGIDRLNWEIQRRGAELGESFTEALRQIHHDVLQLRDEREGYFYPSESLLDRRSRELLVLVAGLRYMTRALKFPQIAAARQGEFQEATAYLESILDAPGKPV